MINYVAEIKKIIPETVEEFYKHLLEKDSFRVFYKNDKKAERLKERVSGVIGRILDNYDNIATRDMLQSDGNGSGLGIGDELKNIINGDSYLERASNIVASLHFSMDIPYTIIINGFEIFEGFAVDNLKRHYLSFPVPCSEKSVNLENYDNSLFKALDFINNLFSAFKNNVSKTYLYLTIDNDINLIGRLESVFGNLSFYKDLNLANSYLMLDVIKHIKRNDLEDYSNIKDCRLTKMLQSNYFNNKLIQGDDKRHIEEIHEAIHNSIRNLSSYLKEKKYAHSMQIYMTIFKLYLMISTIIYGRTSGDNALDMERELDLLKNFDKLTGLYSKEKFMSELNALIKNINEAGTAGRGFALIYMNIYSFKSINEIYGYVFGNSVLVKFSKFLKSIFRHDGDLVARFDKDEFFVIVKTVQDEKVMLERLKKFFRFRKITVKGITISLKINGGVVVSDGKSSSEELVGKAYETIKKLKEIKDRYVVSDETAGTFIGYSDIKRQIARYNKKLEKRDFILKAMEKDRIIPVFQPIMDLRNHNAINKYEALMRIKDEDGSLLPPYEYILIAEEFGLIAQMDLIMIEKSIRVMRECQGDIILDLNLSGKEITLLDFVNKIENLINKYSVQPDNVIFEITETAAIKDIEMAENFITNFKSKGFKFALDDFGIGFSSLFYLKSLKVDYVKLDGYFVRDLVKSKESYYLLSSLVSMAKAFNTETIAEFVETGEILRKLRELGVDFAQGNYIGKPSPHLL